MASHALPDGYAVESASLRLTLSEPPSATPATLGLWELDVHNWTQSGATWNTYDGVNNWSTPGAYGADRLGMLSSHVMTSEVTGASLEFNATLAVQNAMREERGLDLILDVLNPGSGQTHMYTSQSLFHNSPKINGLNYIGLHLWKRRGPGHAQHHFSFERIMGNRRGY